MNKNTKHETPRPPARVGRLDTIGAIVSEMGRLYRQARKGQLDTSDASRLSQILALMRQGLEASTLEQQIAELRTRIEATTTPPRTQLPPAPDPIPFRGRVTA